MKRNIRVNVVERVWVVRLNEEGRLLLEGLVLKPRGRGLPPDDPGHSRGGWFWSRNRVWHSIDSFFVQCSVRLGWRVKTAYIGMSRWMGKTLG